MTKIKVNSIILIIGLVFTACSSNNIPNPYTIEITGENYEWHIRYPGKDGQLYTTDDFYKKRNLYLPKGIPVEITLKSKDYLYFFELPEYQQISLAVPDKTYQLVFTPNKTGQSPLKGNQMCAYTHEKLIGTLSVYSTTRFAWWCNRNEK